MAKAKKRRPARKPYAAVVKLLKRNAGIGNLEADEELHNILEDFGPLNWSRSSGRIGIPECAIGALSLTS